MRNQMLQYYMHDGPSAFRFELAGKLDDEAARELSQAWRTASAVIGDRSLVIDMTFVTGAEGEGRSLLARWFAQGAHLIARTRASRELAEGIIGEPLSRVRAMPKASALGSRFTQPSTDPSWVSYSCSRRCCFQRKWGNSWLSVTASKAIWHARHPNVPALRQMPGT